MNGAALRVACYVARAHGLDGLRTLLRSNRYRVACILTHRRLARFEDPARNERPDFNDFKNLAEIRKIPFLVGDSRGERARIVEQLKPLRPDLLVSISWRNLISPAELKLPRLGGVNLHRGKLPDFAGAFPIARALERGDAEIVVTAQVLAEEIDAGQTLVTVSHPVNRGAHEATGTCVARLKREITPLFGPLLIEALNRMVEMNG